MSLKEKIRTEFKEAFKAREEIKVSVLKMLNSEIANAEISKRTKFSKKGEITDLAAGPELSDDEVMEVVSREIKKRKESADIYEKNGRDDLAKKERKESEFLLAYLPEQMTESKIRDLAKKAVEQAGAKSQKETGKVMAILMPQVKGKSDGSLVNKIVRELLG